MALTVHPRTEVGAARDAEASGKPTGFELALAAAMYPVPLPAQEVDEGPLALLAGLVETTLGQGIPAVLHALLDPPFDPVAEAMRA